MRKMETKLICTVSNPCRLMLKYSILRYRAAKWDGIRYIQVISVNGQQVFKTKSPSDKRAVCWRVSMDCLDQNCGTVSAYRWVDTTIRLDIADPWLGTDSRLDPEHIVNLTTSNGGVGWRIHDINVPEFIFGQP